ncbi:MAG: GH116 family glycosyl-hydrolase, partial [Candidatus Hodarchaeota archaeon]
MLFQTDQPTRKWQEFQVKGYDFPVSGLIYKASNPSVCGVPLGGVGTGCIDIECDGTLGYSTIFNSLWPRAGPLNLPFLGISIGRESWILSTKSIHGAIEGVANQFNESITKSMDEIFYFGHYPVADLEYTSSCPLQLALRAWSPFIPGDIKVSATPCSIFELYIKNPTEKKVEGVVVFSFPGPESYEVEENPIFHHKII